MSDHPLRDGDDTRYLHGRNRYFRRFGMALAGVLTARLMPETGLPAAVLAAVAVSCRRGLLYRNYGRQAQITAMVITLGLMLGLRGVAQVLWRRPRHLFQQAGGSGKTAIPLGTYKLGGVIPVQIIPIVLSVADSLVMIEKNGAWTSDSGGGR